MPPPKVDSQVLGFKRKAPDIPLVEIDKFERFLRLVFGQRRKQLAGVLKASYPKTEEIMISLSIDPRIRAEALTYNQVIDLYTALTLKDLSL